MQNLDNFRDFLIEHGDEYDNNMMFSVVFPVVCIRLNKVNNISEIFKIFLMWWNNNPDYVVINDDVNITLKFIEYYNSDYELRKHDNNIFNNWVDDKLLNNDYRLN